MKLTTFSQALVVTLSLVVLGGCEQQSPADIYLQDPQAVKRGRLIYTGTCGGYCHNSATQRSEAPNLFDCNWLHGGSDQQIFNSIYNGIEGTQMIGFSGKLPAGDDDIWKLVAYLKQQRSC